MATKKRRRLWRVVFALLVPIVAVTIYGWWLYSNRHFSQPQFLAQVVQAELAGVDESNVQPLGWSLAILGRDDEVRKLDFHPQFEFPKPSAISGQLGLKAIPWRIGLKQVAKENQIVMIMEDHFVSKHREMIAESLAEFRNAGFTHYAAEAIGESSSLLSDRGYPVVKTGFYTSDPQFGNVLRKALALNFNVLGYDFRPFSHERREEFAATELAKLFKNNRPSKLLIHAGHAHVLKHKTETGQRWLAERLWHKTGIEPFTIWQWSDLRDAHDYRIVARELAKIEDFTEPLLLVKPPDPDCGLQNVPRVDAILVHPPDASVAPDDRTVLFPNTMKCISGRWTSEQWPVVISVYKKGEPVTAIPLDQVLLREAENKFSLWIPNDTEFELRVFDVQGVVASKQEHDGDSVHIGRAN